ncbi:MAG: hypothetical protein ABIK43_07440 [candidate division WOR-3 bacterium]
MADGCLDVLLPSILSGKAQDSVTPLQGCWRDLAPKLFIRDDTQADLDYIRSEIVFVNYVRDPADANIHLAITCQTTGAGGREYCLTFTGLGDLQEIKSVQTYTTEPDATSDDIRRGLADAIRRGLVPYVSRTPLRDNLSVEFTPPAELVSATDRWKN